MRHGYQIALGLCLVLLGPIVAGASAPPQAPEPPQAPAVPATYSAGESTPVLDAVSLALATALQPVQAPASPPIPSVTLTPGVFYGTAHKLADDRYHLHGGLFVPEAQPVTVQPADQASYLTRGWRFVDSGQAATFAPGTSTFYAAPLYLGDSGGCANGSCGSSGSTRRGLFGRRR